MGNKSQTHKNTFELKLELLERGGWVDVKQYELVEIMHQCGFGKFLVKMDEDNKFSIKIYGG